MMLGRLAVLLGSSLLIAVPVMAQSWTQPHANANQDGFVDVATAPAAAPTFVRKNLGSFAPGVGPVVGKFGDAYVGTREGKLVAIGSTGTIKWTLDLNDRSINLSAVIADDRSIFVISDRGLRDQTHDANGFRPQKLKIHHVSPDGVLLWTRDFPAQRNWRGPIGTGLASAPPVLGQYGGHVVVFLTVRLVPNNGHYLNLIAFDDTGTLLGNKPVTQTTFDLSNDPNDINAAIWDTGGRCLHLACFKKPDGSPFSRASDPAGRLPEGIAAVLPGVALTHYGDTDWVIVSDGLHNVVLYSYDYAHGLSEKSREPAVDGVLTSGPSVQPDGHAVVGIHKGMLGFAGPNTTRLRDLTLGWDTVAVPARNANADAVVLNTYTHLQLVAQGRSKVDVELPGETIASPAVSKGHVFVSVPQALLTYDATTLTKLASYAWHGGGLSTPAIGRDGRVYALAGTDMYIFVPPSALCSDKPSAAGCTNAPPRPPHVNTQ